MTSEPVDKWTGTPLSQWLELVPGELDVDAVGFWQVIPALRISFGLDDADIERFARLAISNLLAHGARLVVRSGAPGEYWSEVATYGTTPEENIDGVIGEWHALGRDPDVGDLWFARPDLFRDDP
jgi:hypothetical protein